MSILHLLDNISTLPYYLLSLDKRPLSHIMSLSCYILCVTCTPLFVPHQKAVQAHNKYFMQNKFHYSHISCIKHIHKLPDLAQGRCTIKGALLIFTTTINSRSPLTYMKSQHISCNGFISDKAQCPNMLICTHLIPSSNGICCNMTCITFTE